MLFKLSKCELEKSNVGTTSDVCIDQDSKLDLILAKLESVQKQICEDRANSMISLASLQVSVDIILENLSKISRPDTLSVIDEDFSDDIVFPIKSKEMLVAFEDKLRKDLQYKQKMVILLQKV